MTRRQRLEQLEEQCQRCYTIIDTCHLTIANAQKELESLELKYLKAKAAVDKLSPIKQTRMSKLERLRKSLIELGIDDVDSFFRKLS